MANLTPFTAAELAALLPRLQATLDLLDVALQHKLVIERSAGAARTKKAPRAAKRAVAKTKAATPSLAKPILTVSNTKPAGRPKAKKSKRRSPEQSNRVRNRVLEFLKGAKAGASARDVGAKLNVGTEAAAYALRKLRGEKKVKMIGQRSQAKWHLAA